MSFKFKSSKNNKLRPILISYTVVTSLFLAMLSFSSAAGDWFEIRLMTASKKSSISRLITQLKLPQEQVRIHESTAGDKLVYILASEPFDSKEKAQQALSARNYPKDAYVAKSKYDGQHQSIESRTAESSANDSTYFRLMQVLGGVNMAYTAQQQKLAEMESRTTDGDEKTLPEAMLNCLKETISRRGIADEFMPLYKNYFTLAQAGEIIFFAGIKEDPETSEVLKKLQAKIDGYLTPTVKQELQQRMGFLSSRFVKRAITHCLVKTQDQNQQ
jgi:hypothetical protein